MTTPPHEHEPPDLRPGAPNLPGAPGARYWRSLEELAGSEEFLQYLRREFPEQAVQWRDPSSRRRFFRLMGASMALAGVSGCAIRTPEQIVPYVKAPEEIVPGKPLDFATALPFDGYGIGVIVESQMGRPVKVEGNPDHPASLGGTDALAQAAILTLYDPDRSQLVTHNGRASTWNDFLTMFIGEVARLRAKKGAGLRILTRTITSPTLADQFEQLLRDLPEARWHQYDPVGSDAARLGAQLAFGAHVATHHHIDRADVILSLDADFLAWGPGRLRDARQFALRREPGRPLNRLYVVEPTPTITGSMADHRLPVPTRDVAAIAWAVAHTLGVEGLPAPSGNAVQKHAAWIDAVARDLEAHKGRSLVLAGQGQPAAIHALAHAMNLALKNEAVTVSYTEPVEARPVDQLKSLRELVRDIDAAKVETLLILGGNPAYDAPADLGFAERLEPGKSKVRLRIHLGQYEDETAALCNWHIPEAHPLESWGDVRACDGSVSIIQPLIAPLHGGRSAQELLAALMGQPTRSPLEILRDFWKTQKLPGEFEAAWRTALHKGVIDGTALKPKTVRLQPLADTVAQLTAVEDQAPSNLEIVFRPDPTTWDGQFANNGWLQELPKPITKLVWDNAAMINPALADRLNLSDGDLVTLRLNDRQIEAAIWRTPGQAEESVTLHLGYGRTRAGRIGNGAGFNAYALRTTRAFWSGAGLQITKTGRGYPLASTQHHFSMENRNLVREATYEHYRAEPDFAQKLDEHVKADLTLLPAYPYEGYAWGMAINLNTCIGCGACVVACQAENNIPIVGKDQVLRGRQMHWIRIDRYFEGDDPAQPTSLRHQPVPCMHCENAPCELVCPVGATLHDAEGLNVMVYNRCVGTRYCSNNCPYKVRRFNFYHYNGTRLNSDLSTQSLDLLHNPEVTVRYRGVMEKCSYCIQRITRGRIAAEQEDRRIRDGEVETACQAACPTRAIVFGDINDPNSRVAQAKAEPRNYALLAELNTRPRTTYLAKLTNPNPEIKGGAD
jgi:MoCo/4Fe-4S cofactor protein with predicted Tat translocation signal